MVRLVATILFLGAAVCQPAESLEGRWEGLVQIPGNDLRFIVDLSSEGSEKGWIGSIIVPGFGIKGAELVDNHQGGGNLFFTIKGALGNQRAGQAQLQARLTSDGHLAGNFVQGGNTAPFILTKTGPAQVEQPPRSTGVAKEAEGEWKGDYEMMGYTRHATIKFGPRRTDAFPVEFTIVGKKVNNVPVSLVTQDGDFITVKSEDFGITLEGRFSKDAGEIKGTLSQGPLEAPLVLRKTR